MSKTTPSALPGHEIQCQAEGCSTVFPRRGRKRFCSARCRDRHKASSRRVPCAVCGEPMHWNPACLPVGQASHNRCKNRTVAGEVIHGRAAYDNGQCACRVCLAANAARTADWCRRTGYKSRPEVLERGRAQHLQRILVPEVQYTAEQLAARLSMYSGCWICGHAVEGVPHVDHVKPLARGGWDCLANIRPAHQFCNQSKGARWPFDPEPYRLEPPLLVAA